MYILPTNRDMPSKGNLLLEKEFMVKIRDNYNHDSQLQDFIAKDLPSFKDDNIGHIVSNSIIRLNKNKAMLIAGEEYCVKVFKLKTVCWFPDYVDFFKEDGALLTGSHGLTYLAQEHKEIFSEKPCRYIVLAEEEFLPKKNYSDPNSKTIIPIITNWAGNTEQMESKENFFIFSYVFFYADVDPNKIICFYDKSKFSLNW